MSPARIYFCAALLLVENGYRFTSASLSNLTIVQSTTKSENITATVQLQNPRTLQQLYTQPVGGQSPSLGTALQLLPGQPVINTTSAEIPTTNLPAVSHFDIGSFVGGILLALVLVTVFYFGRRLYASSRGRQYRTM
ncbi:porimin [Pristis pectinata]|uniref:porimin n=1 Tax=Pristis pectinata TaxID=685728 RepID=UPI00223CCAC2|nr:porimin [Pristis pectinata]